MTPAAANSFLGGTPGASSDGRGAFTHSATTPFVETQGVPPNGCDLGSSIHLLAGRLS